MATQQTPTAAGRRWRLIDLLGGPGAFAAACGTAAATATVHFTINASWADVAYRFAACCAIPCALWAAWGTHIQIPGLRSFHAHRPGYKDLVHGVYASYILAAATGILAVMWALASTGTAHMAATVAGVGLMTLIPCAIISINRRLRLTVPSEDLWQFQVFGIGWIAKIAAERAAADTETVPAPPTRTLTKDTNTPPRRYPAPADSLPH